MAVVVIARELAALGDETAIEVAKLLNYRYINKEKIDTTLIEYGVNDRLIERYEEKKPGFFDALSSKQNKYLHYLKTVLYQETVEGNCVLVGQGAPVILRGVPGVVTIKLISPENIRLERIKKRYNCDEKRAAFILNQTDNDRMGFYRYFFDINWRDPINYDFIINTENNTAKDTALMIRQLLSIVTTRELEKEGEKTIHSLIRGQKIITEIIYEQNLPIYFLEVKYEGDKIILNGVTNVPSCVDKAIYIAKEVDGTDNIKSNIYIASDVPVNHEF